MTLIIHLKTYKKDIRKFAKPVIRYVYTSESEGKRILESAMTYAPFRIVAMATVECLSCRGSRKWDFWKGALDLWKWSPDCPQMIYHLSGAARLDPNHPIVRYDTSTSEVFTSFALAVLPHHRHEPEQSASFNRRAAFSSLNFSCSRLYLYTTF